MKSIKALGKFTKFEIFLLTFSLTTITTFFLIFDRKGYLNYFVSLLGAVALIFCAKGNPIGQVFVIIFSTLYSIISYKCAYFGELATYAGMTLPMAIISLISWLKNPSGENGAEVKVNTLKKREYLIGVLLCGVVTLAFHFILKALNTANLLVSTISIATSFFAAYLTFRRSPFYALAYALNDVVLIILWAFMLAKNSSYISVLTCFIVFLLNDLYGFINWKKLQKKQNK